MERALSSCEINRDLLQPVELVLKKYDSLIRSGPSEGNIRMLAVKLAKEAIFGEGVMGMCTPGGTHDLLALPNIELYNLKRILLGQYPQYWKSLHDFEGVWKKC